MDTQVGKAGLGSGTLGGQIGNQAEHPKQWLFTAQ